MKKPSTLLLTILLYAFLIGVSAAGAETAGQTTAVQIWGVSSSDDGLSLYDTTGERLNFVGPLNPDPNVYQVPIALTTVPGTGEILVWNNIGGPFPSGELLRVDPATGLAAPVDPNTSPQSVSLGGIAFGPDGSVYGTNYDLYRIDPHTGVATRITSLGLRVVGLAFSPSGDLFGVELSTGPERLVTIDPETGAVTVVGTLSEDIGIIGDIVFTASGRLIGSAFAGSFGNIFFDLDPTTAAVSDIRPTGLTPQGMGLVEPFTFNDPGAATDKLYWTDNDAGTVNRSNLDGTGAEALVSQLAFPRGVAADAALGHIYYAADTEIWRVGLDGSSPTVLYGALTPPGHVAVDTSRGMLYWSSDNAILSAPLDGSGSPQSLLAGLAQPQDVEVDVGNGKIYWAERDAGFIRRANLDGSGVETLVSGLDVPSGIAVDPGAGNLYFSDRGQDRIRRTNLDGTGMTDVLAIPNVQDVEIDPNGGKIYWTNRDDQVVQRANLDGSAVETLHTANDPLSLALATIPEAPSPTISSISPTYVQASSSVDLTLTVNGTGFVQASRIRWNGTELDTTLISASQLQATVPSSLLAEPATVEITVYTPAPGGGESNLVVFFVTPASVDLSAYDSATSTDGSGATASTGDASATATGDGTVVVAEYSANPAEDPLFAETGVYFDVYLSSDNTFTELTLELCHVDTGQEAHWWNGTEWIVASDQRYDSSTGCITVFVDDTTSPSLDDLTETPFTVADTPPATNVDLESQEVQYSDAIAPVTITATDVGDSSLVGTSWSADGSGGEGLPDGITLAPAGCNKEAASTLSICEWTLAGTADVVAGTYEITISIADNAGGVSEANIILVVLPEEASVTFHGGNPVAVQVSEPGGDSDPFSLRVSLREQYPDEGAEPLPGDIAQAQLAVSLAPVGPGSVVHPTGCTHEVTGDGYDRTVRLTCSFDQVPVNTYAAVFSLEGKYYQALAEDVLTVYDPTLGYASGGGWFYWPVTDDKTSFGFTMEYNNKGTNVKGSLLLIRHLPDGTYEVKSNALEGLALGVVDEGYGWASFSGKATYSEPSWTEAEGNHEFVLYVEDQNEPGDGTDRVWIQIIGKDGTIIPAMSTAEPAENNAVNIQEGNIIIPH